MNFEQIDKSPKTFILVFKTGDELAKGLSQFAEEQKLSAASFKAVGALNSVRLGWFNWESKKYEPSVTLDEQVELLSSSAMSRYMKVSRLSTPMPWWARKTALLTAATFSKRASGQRARWCSRKARPIFKSMSTPNPALL